MKLAVIWHLIGVLLIDGALATVIHIEEAVTSATTTTTAAVRAPPVVVARERKLPRLDHVNGLKKPPPKSEILVQQQQQQQQQNSPDESTSTTSRSFRPDYLAAKNTVPVAVAPTEATFRKFSRPRLIPGPSPALLAVKAASASSSTTERGLDSSIPPTGWALAALGPSSSRGTTGFGGKRFSSPSTIVKPISTFWSTRLFKTTTSSSFPEMLDLQDEPHNATTVRAQPENEESMEENIGTTAKTPLTTTTTTTTTTTSTTTTTTTSTTSTPTTTVTIDPEIENLPPATPPVKITESNETVSNVTATTMTTTSSTTPMTTSDASTVPPSSTTTVLADNLIKQLQYASNEINGTTTSTTITTPTITLLPPFGNNTEENTIATPMAKSNTIEESLGSTKSEIQDLSSTTTPEMEEMTIGTATIGKSVASTTEIPALVVTTTTPVEETTVVTGTDQTLKTLAKSNSTSKIITAVMNETTTETQPSVATTTPLPSSTLSNDIPDVAKSGKNKPPVVVNSTETAGNYIPISTPAVQVGEDLNVVNRSTVPPQIQNFTEYSSGINETTTAVETSTETLNHSKNEIKSLEFDNKIDRTKQIQPTIFPSTTTDSTTSHPQGHAVTNLNNFHYDLDNKTETPAVILNEGGGSGDSDEDDDTLKYNVTGGVHHDDGHPDDYDDFDQVSSPPQGNVTTEIPVGTVNDTKNELGRTITTTTVSTSPSTVVTTVSIVSVSETTTYVFDHTIPGEDEDDEESVIVPMNVRVHIQASYKQMCLAKEMFRNTIVAALSEETTKPVERDQVEILNLGPNECDGLTSTDGDVIPINLLLMTPQGKYDRSLTEILFSLIKHGRLNFKFPITQVDKLVSQMLEPPVHQMGGTVILAIIISSIAGICLLFLTILIVIMRKRQKGFNYGQRCTPVSLDDYSLDNISVCNSVRRKAMRASKRSYGNPAFDDPVALTNPLNFAGLVNAVSDKSKIEEEFDRVPVVSVKPDELPPGAESKNRYANVIPLPETRVQLNGPSTNLTGNSDADHFINANYVKGPKGADKFYVACQAPLQNTVADFWQMIWEQQSRVIIMLTDLHENGVEKSADYLPPSEVLDCHRVFGDLQVTLKKREVRDKYVISSLQLKNLVSNLWREVTHLWYSGWPTRGVPDDCSSMIAFLIEARSYSKAGPPVVVHCSPGTGRTGTVIAIDTAIRDYETTRTVDIPKTVYNIRRDRAGAVQTSQQYLFIYQVLHLYATKLAGGGLDSI